MKKTFLFRVLALSTLVVVTTVACRNNAGTTGGDEAATSQQDDAAQAEAAGVQRLNVYDYSDNVSIDGHTYSYSIHRQPSDSLPTVTDDFGTVFADNIYNLSISRDGSAWIKRSFTKADFAHLLSSELRQRGILDGMRLDTLHEQLTFAVSVSIPQSDLYEPFLVTINGQGGVAIAADTSDEY